VSLAGNRSYLGDWQDENLHPVCVGVFPRSYRVNSDREAQESGERSVQQFVEGPEQFQGSTGWVDLPWIDQYSGKQYEITTEGFHGSRGVARVKTYGEVLREYEFHLGAKSADAKGKPSGKQTFGLLGRRHVRVERIIYIGRESNRLEEIEAGVIHSPDSVYTEYPDPNRDEWQTRILPILNKIPIAALMRVSGRSRSMLRRTLAGRSTPRRKNQQLLKSILQRLGAV